MAVSSTTQLADGNFTSFKGFYRSSGPVGTFSFIQRDVGDATGGGLSLIMSMGRLQFGFHALIVPTIISIQDNLATPEAVELVYLSTNRRVQAVPDGGTSLRDVLVPTAGASGNTGVFTGSKPILEVQDVGPVNVMNFIWSTNTDTAIYRVSVYGLVYDGEYQAKSPLDFVNGPLAGPL